MMEFREAVYLHGLYQRAMRSVFVNPDEIAAAEEVTDEPMSPMGGPWSMFRITFRCGKTVMVEASKDDFRNSRS